MTDKGWNPETWKEMEARLSDAEAQIRRLLDERDALINERDEALALEKAKVTAEVRAQRSDSRLLRPSFRRRGTASCVRTLN